MSRGEFRSCWLEISRERGVELCTTVALMRKVGDITPDLLDGSCIRSDKVDDARYAACQSRGSCTKVKAEAERDVIYLIFSKQLYFGSIIFL